MLVDLAKIQAERTEEKPLKSSQAQKIVKGSELAESQDEEDLGPAAASKSNQKTQREKKSVKANSS